MLSSLFGKKPACMPCACARERRVPHRGPGNAAAGGARPGASRSRTVAARRLRRVQVPAAQGHKVKELTDKSYLLSAEEIRDNYVLACQSIP